MISIRQLPNILTVARGVMTIVIIALFYTSIKYRFSIILGLFCLASITDFFDGMIARKYKAITKFGIVFDSLFDKILILSMFMLLIPYNTVPGWLLVLFLVRELTVDALKNYLLSQGKPVSAKITGKLKMVFQVVFVVTALLWLITNNSYLPIINLVLAGAALLSAYISGWQYVRVWIKEG